MNSPKVSFVIPCYKLGHLLGECINSILAQSYADFEILVLDDQSPDNTREVAASFTDSRVIYIRNDQNLGHLRNYNKGISMSRGNYIWLISADDYLRSHEVLKKYVDLMERHPKIGYSFCAGFGVLNGQEVRTIGAYGNQDRIISGHEFLKDLLRSNFILAPSVLVRRDCYETISNFPLKEDWNGTPINMGWLGDWYLWCVYALKYDVAYFAEPMVCYRIHELSMSSNITQKETVQDCADSEIGMLWLLHHKAREIGAADVERECLNAIAMEYRNQAAAKPFRASVYVLEEEHFEDSLQRSTIDKTVRESIRAEFYAGAGYRFAAQGDWPMAREQYWRSLKKNPLSGIIYLKLFLAVLGRPGASIRGLFVGLRNSFSN